MDGKKLTVILVVVSMTIFVLFGAGALLINKVADKAADKVMLRLQRDYTPGPYAPGFDPDKIPSRASPYVPNVTGPQQPRTWEQSWEAQRH